jgi:hypothetical protein
MAGNLTPEQMAQLYRLFSTPVESSDPNANSYMPENVYMDGRTYDRRDAGYMGYDYNPTDWTDPRTQESQSLFNGQSFDEYGKDGTFSNSGVFTGIEDRNKYGDMIGALSILAMPFAAAGLGAGAAGAGAAGAGAGAGGMVNGAFLGEGALSGIGAWDGALAGAGAAGAGGGAAADGLLNGLNGSDIMSDAFVQNGGYGAGGFGGSNGGLLSSLTSSLTNGGGGSDWTSLLTKYGPGILGGLVGGKSGSEGSNTQKTMDPRLDPHIFGDKGGFARAYGLLDTPVAPNAFERFYGGR